MSSFYRLCDVEELWCNLTGHDNKTINVPVSKKFEKAIAFVPLK